MKKYLRYIKALKGYKIDVFFLGTLIIISVGLEILFPYINGKFIDRLITAINFKNIIPMVSMLFIIGLGNQLLKYYIRCTSCKISETINFDIKQKMLDVLRKVKYQKYKSLNSAYLNQRINSDVVKVVGFFIDNYISILAKFVQLSIIVYILGRINLRLMLVILLICPLYYYLYKRFKAPIFQKSLKAKEQMSVFFQSYNDQLEYMEEIVTEANYSVQDNNLKEAFKNYFENIFDYTKTIASFGMTQGIFALIFQIIVFLIGGYNVINKKMTIGQLTTITSYFVTIMANIAYYIDLGKDFQITKSSLKRLEELLNLEKRKDGSKIIPEIEDIKANISFSYNQESKVLNNVKIMAEKGEIVGIIGFNGSGKTTLSKILIGVLQGYDNDETEIIFNEEYSIEEINTVELRREKIAYIPQNIRGINKSLCGLFNEVAYFSNVDEFINSLTNMGVELTEELNAFIKSNWSKEVDSLSGGDKQVISIIKNLIKRPDVLFFDEPTSNLDKERVNWLKKTLMSIKNNKIIFVISHDQELFDIFNKKIAL